MIEFISQFNQCSKILCLLFTTISVLFFIDFYFQIVFFNGIFLFAYLSCIVTVTILITTILIQHVLKFNKPIDYNLRKKYLEIILKVYRYIYNTSNNGTNAVEHVKPEDFLHVVKDPSIDVRIEEFIKDIEQRFILNWYKEISTDAQFLKETERLLDEIIRRFMQIVIAIDNKALVQGIFAILLRHIKEFKKAAKRSQKNGICIESAYRYCHVGSTSTEKYEEFICHLTTKLLKQFVTSELWSSLVWRTLVSILSKKLTTTTLVYVSQPGFINYLMVNVCANPMTKDQLQLHKMTYISLSNIDRKEKVLKPKHDQFDKPKSYLKATDTIDGACTPKLSPKKATKKPMKADRIKSVSESKQLQQPQQVVSTRIASEPVKIYRSSSEKTWRNSSDLECVSLGEDLLALQEICDPDTQIQSLIERKPWKDTADSLDVEEKSHNILETIFKEDDDDVSPSGLQAATQMITNTMKPIGNVTASTLQNMKDFQQCTVNSVNSVVKPISQVTNSAKHKIGDLQDEAAGMMEGIFDFGMAGIRKGLRLTGLQDNINETIGKKDKLDEGRKRSNGKQSRKLTKSSQAVYEDDKLEKTSSNESDENVWMNPLTKLSPNFDGEILLEKSPIKEETAKSQDVPKISMDLDTTSPDLEYEDTVDLATTTAKLRSLLAQRTSESTTPAVSPMPQDDKVTPSIERLVAAELNDVDGVMPSLYKFYNKTATGIQQTFNTLKTALPGNEKMDEKPHTVDGINWQFVPDKKKENLMKKMEKLLSERRDYCIIDPAYDYVEILDQTDGAFSKNDQQFDDDLDEFDIQVPMAKMLLEIVCELLTDTNTYFTQEPIIKCFLVLFGKVIEEKLDEDSRSFFRHIKNYIRKLPTNTMEYPLAMKIEKMIDCCLESVPGYITTIIGKDSIADGLKTLITSFQCLSINRDVFLQILELCTIHLVRVNNLMSPTYSA